MQHGPRGPPRGQMQGFRRDFPPNEDPAWEKAVRSIFGTFFSRRNSVATHFYGSRVICKRP